MILLRQSLPKVFQTCYSQAVARRSQLSPITPFSFSRSKPIPFAPIAGGGFSTDEFYPDARETPPGAAAQDRTGHAQRLLAGSPDWIWPASPFQFPAPSAATLTRGH